MNAMNPSLPPCFCFAHIMTCRPHHYFLDRLVGTICEAMHENGALNQQNLFAGDG